MRKVMVFGSFDVLHDGHRSLFKQARTHGDKLIVIVARDATYEGLRGHAPMHGEYVRLKGVAEESLVDEAYLGDAQDPYRVLRRFRPDVVCLGYDQEAFVGGLSERLSSYGLRGVPIIRLEPFSPERHKSSLIKKRLLE
jgi:FAD synthetase